MNGFQDELDSIYRQAMAHPEDVDTQKSVYEYLMRNLDLLLEAKETMNKDVNAIC